MIKSWSQKYPWSTVHCNKLAISDVTEIKVSTNCFSFPGLRERLAAGEDIICAEGYVIELESRCYLQAGAFVPEIVLENGNVLRAFQEELVHAGSDVVEALTVSEDGKATQS